MRACDSSDRSRCADSLHPFLPLVTSPSHRLSESSHHSHLLTVNTVTDDRRIDTGGPPGFGPPRKKAKPFYDPQDPSALAPIELASPTRPSCINIDINFRRKDVSLLFQSPALYGKR